MPACLESCDPQLKDALLLLLDAVSTRSLAVPAVVGLHMYADIIRDYDPKSFTLGNRVLARLDAGIPGFSNLTEIGLIMAFAYVLKGRPLAEAVRQAARQCGSSLDTVNATPILDVTQLAEPPSEMALLQERASRHGLTSAEYVRFIESGALAE